jgi:hypothetical protein
MSKRGGNVALIYHEPPRQCEVCKQTAECRPYGPKGEQICYDCARKDIATTERQMRSVLFGETLQ